MDEQLQDREFVANDGSDSSLRAVDQAAGALACVRGRTRNWSSTAYFPSQRGLPAADVKDEGYKDVR